MAETNDWWPAEARRIKRRNLFRAPFVLLIRAPILVTLWLLGQPGRGCLALADWLSRVLPGFDYVPADPKNGRRP